jgi:HAE1 family hydrophobic/amphiphilic exporter-1
MFLILLKNNSSPTIFREKSKIGLFQSAAVNRVTDLSTAVAEIKKIIAILQFLPIISRYLAELPEDQQEAFFLLRISIYRRNFLVYMIMASQFETLIDPFIIMFTVPLSNIGVFFFLGITGTK